MTECRPPAVIPGRVPGANRGRVLGMVLGTRPRITVRRAEMTG